MSEHTPGPWWQSGSIIYRPGERGATICAMAEPRASKYVDYHPLKLGSPDWEEQMANARLIAAAPEMLAALRDHIAVGVCRCGDEMTMVRREKCRYCADKAAIAKATGESP